MPFVWSVGTILGPTIGGYFALPAEGFPDTFSEDGLFGRFPFLLPNLICVGLMIISIFAGYFCLEETHPNMQHGSLPTSEEIAQMRRKRAESMVVATQPTEFSAAVNLTNESYGTFNAVSEDAIEEEWNLKADGGTRTPSLYSEMSQKVFSKRIVMLIAALGIFTYHGMTYDHLLPIFLQDDRMRAGDTSTILLSTLSNGSGSLAGGLGLSVKNVGFIMSINGIIALVVQAVLFPLMASWLGVWRVFIVVTVLHPIAYFIVPWLALLPQNLLYPGIYFCLAVRNCLSILAYPVLLILIKEASPSPSCLGKINGLAASTGAACRTVASPIAGLLYGIGINISLTAIAWWASALVAVVGAAQALMIKRNDHGDQYQVHAAAPCRFAEAGEQYVKHKPSIVRIRLQPDRRGGDSGYGSDNDERRPLIA